MIRCYLKVNVVPNWSTVMRIIPRVHTLCCDFTLSAVELHIPLSKLFQCPVFRHKDGVLDILLVVPNEEVSLKLNASSEVK